MPGLGVSLSRVSLLSRLSGSACAYAVLRRQMLSEISSLRVSPRGALMSLTPVASGVPLKSAPS